MRQKTLSLGLASALLSLGAIACEDSRPLEPIRPTQPPLALSGALLYVDAFQDSALLVDVSEHEGRTRRLSLAEGVSWTGLRPAQPTPQAVVLSVGAASRADKPERPGTLSLIDHEGVVQEYPLPGRFDSVQLSANGQYALVYVQESLGVLSLPNQVGVVDLTRPADDENPLSLQVTYSEHPLGGRFSPPVEIAGEERQLLIVLSPGGVGLVDLGHPERGDIFLPLTLNAPQTVTPKQVLFDGRNIYVRTDNPSVTVLQLNPLASAEPGEHDFSVSIVQLPTSSAPSELALLDTDDGRRVLALSQGHADIMDPAAGSTVSAPLAAPYTRLLPFEAEAPDDPNVRPRALLWGPGSASVTFLNLTGTDQRLARGLEVLHLEAPVDAALPLPSAGLVALVHEQDRRVSVLDLARRTVSPAVANMTLEKAVLDPARARLWLANEGSARLGHLNLTTPAAGEVLLDATPRQILPVGGPRPVIVVTHAADAGYVTLLDAERPTRNTARSLRGFFWDGLLDGEEEEEVER